MQTGRPVTGEQMSDIMVTAGKFGGAGGLAWLIYWVIKEIIARLSTSKELSDAARVMVANLRAEMDQMRADHSREVAEMRAELGAAQTVIREMLRVGNEREARERERDDRERRLEREIKRLRSALQKAVRALDSDDPLIRSDAIQAARELT